MIGHRPDVRLVYLKGDRALIAKRLVARHGHFMAASLLESQFAALEEPASEERAISIWVGSLRRCSSTKSSPRLPLGK
jgi:gluconokinase